VARAKEEITKVKEKMPTYSFYYGTLIIALGTIYEKFSDEEKKKFMDKWGEVTFRFCSCVVMLNAELMTSMAERNILRVKGGFKEVEYRDP